MEGKQGGRMEGRKAGKKEGKQRALAGDPQEQTQVVAGMGEAGGEKEGLLHILLP